MRNLVVDVGNTATKVGIFEQRELLEEQTFLQTDELIRFIRQVNVEAAIYSTVNKDEALFLDATKHISQTFILTHSLPLPISNEYATPETLGMDRLAGVCGANSMFPGQACLVIDAGTCITYDVVDARGSYKGGAISPGLRMRLKAMHQFTARLPMIEIDSNVPLIGNSTVSCMQSGALNGMLAEIQGLIERYRKNNHELRVILCGGDTHFFENNLKGAIFAVQNLVIKGLNSILLHNVSK